MFTVEQIKTKLKDIFFDVIGFDPFEEDTFYKDGIVRRFCLDPFDIVDLIMRMERNFNFELSEAEAEKTKDMNIDQLVDFVSSKCSKN